MRRKRSILIALRAGNGRDRIFLPPTPGTRQTLRMPSEKQKDQATFEVLPDVISPLFDQYLHLSPEERRRRDELHRRRLSDPQHRAFLAGLFKMSLRKKKQSVKVGAAAQNKKV